MGIFYSKIKNEKPNLIIIQKKPNDDLVIRKIKLIYEPKFIPKSNPIPITTKTIEMFHY